MEHAQHAAALLGQGRSPRHSNENTMPTSSTPARPARVLNTRIGPRNPIPGKARNACRLPYFIPAHPIPVA